MCEGKEHLNLSGDHSLGWNSDTRWSALWTRATTYWDGYGLNTCLNPLKAIENRSVQHPQLILKNHFVYPQSKGPPWLSSWLVLSFRYIGQFLSMGGGVSPLELTQCCANGGKQEDRCLIFLLDCIVVKTSLKPHRSHPSRTSLIFQNLMASPTPLVSCDFMLLP